MKGQSDGAQYHPPHGSLHHRCRHHSSTDGRGCSAAPSGLAALIEAHRSAYETFDAAIDRQEEAEQSYRAVYSEPLLIPVLLGGCIGLTTGYEGCRDFIAGAYRNQRDRLAPMARVSPDIAEQVRFLMDAKEAENLALMDQYFADETARQEAFGLAQAKRDWAAASEAEEATATALCAYRSATVEEAAQKARYLLTAPGVRHGLERDQMDALLRSFLPAQG